ncbi:MAG: hypothetical protein AABY22_36430 [Nanoarchaeota archaeon]
MENKILDSDYETLEAWLWMAVDSLRSFCNYAESKKLKDFEKEIKEVEDIKANLHIFIWNLQKRYNKRGRGQNSKYVSADLSLF